jgi:hypothetical protein
MSLASKVYKSQGIQGLLTIGYLFIVILGILGESLYYSQLGINILKYSTVTDVLLSPVSKLTSNIYFILTILGLIIALYLLSGRLDTVEKRDILREKLYKLKISKNANGSLIDSLMIVVVGLLFGFYVGLDLGNGMNTAKKLNKKSFKYNDSVYFTNSDSTHAEILGSNTAYLFYVKKNSNTVLVSPMSAVKSFQNSSNK